MKPVAPGLYPSLPPAVSRTRDVKSLADPELVRAAEGMETMFLDYMMSVMRKTVPKSELGLNSQATEIYQGMLDSEMANRAGRTGGVGLADMIIAHMNPEIYNETRLIEAGTGGTHAGQQSNGKQHRVSRGVQDYKK